MRAADTVTVQRTTAPNEPRVGQATTSRVRLKAIDDGHLGELARLLDASQQFHAGWVSYPTSVESLRAYRDQTQDGGGYLYRVNLADDDTVVGIMSLDRVVRSVWQTAEVGCGLGAAYAGHGLMTDAMKLLVRHAIINLRLRRIEALVQVDNHRSHRMLRAAGFQAEGTARGAIAIDGQPRDHVRWAIIAADLTKPEPTIPKGGDE